MHKVKVGLGKCVHIVKVFTMSGFTVVCTIRMPCEVVWVYCVWLPKREKKLALFLKNVAICIP